MPLVAEPEPLPVAQARAGDDRAWKVLFRRYQLPLFTFVMEMVRHEQTSLDIVQETFVSAVRHLGSLREDGKFGSWLFGIAHRKAVDHWRKAGRKEFLGYEMDEAPPGDEPGPAELLVREEKAAEFFQRVEQLPPSQRAALLLFYLEDFSLEEIARITEVEVGTVKSRLFYAKRALRKLWKEKTP